MLNKLKALWSVFEAGKAVADPAKWKAHQISANAIAALLYAVVQLAKGFGYDFGIDMQTCADIAIGLLAVANVSLTVATSDKIGVRAAPVREAEQVVSSDEAPGEGYNGVPLGSEAHPHIDEATRAAALEWVNRQRQSAGSPTNGLSNDA